MPARQCVIFSDIVWFSPTLCHFFNTDLVRKKWHDVGRHKFIFFTPTLSRKKWHNFGKSYHDVLSSFCYELTLVLKYDTRSVRHCVIFFWLNVGVEKWINVGIIKKKLINFGRLTVIFYEFESLSKKWHNVDQPRVILFLTLSRHQKSDTMSARLCVIFFRHKVIIKTKHRRSNPPYKKSPTLCQKNHRRYVIRH
jgi:hypothetical protein